MNKYYVYIYYDPSRNEPIYVGKGKGDRYFSHLNRTDHSHLPNRIRYMQNHDINVEIRISRLMSEAEAFQQEIDLIASIGRKDKHQGPLLNLTDGGEGASGYICTDEVREKIINGINASMTPEVRAKIGIKHRGKVVSEESRIKMAIGQKLACTEEFRKNLSDAVKAGLTPEAIARATESRRRTWEKKKALKEESLNGLLEY